MASYKDLKVYDKSYELALTMYRDVASQLPGEERYGLVSQVRRAATSIPLNIAEGYGKQAGTKETLRFLQMARGSCCEMAVLLDFLKDLSYIEADEYNRLYTEYDKVGRMLTNLMKTLIN